MPILEFWGEINLFNNNEQSAGTLKIKVLPPVLTSHLKPEDVTKLSEDIRALMEGAIEDVNKES